MLVALAVALYYKHEGEKGWVVGRVVSRNGVKDSWGNKRQVEWEGRWGNEGKE